MSNSRTKRLNTYWLKIKACLGKFNIAEYRKILWTKYTKAKQNASHTLPSPHTLSHYTSPSSIFPSICIHSSHVVHRLDWYRGYGATTLCTPRPEATRPFVRCQVQRRSVKRHQSPLLARNGSGQEMSSNLAYNLRLTRYVTGLFDMPQICDMGQTAC
jgi:hypothetical protein